MKASGGADAWISRSMKRYENPKQAVLGAQVINLPTRFG
jgi:hypothetical protein